MKWVDKASWQLKTLGQRALDTQLSLGVTGLSGAGKTAFLTSALQQLLQHDNQSMPFFSVMQQKRWLGARIDARQALHFPRFPYEQNLLYLKLTEPQWPPSTVGWSQLSLTLRYQSASTVRRLLSDYQQLSLQLLDYPGEWLLDLPMLQQSYSQWCEHCWALFRQPHRQAVAASFREQLHQVDLTQTDPLSVQQLCAQYRDLLQAFSQTAGAYLNQPGRLLVPAELEGTPVLQLLPLLPEQLAQGGALVTLMEQQYQNYLKLVVKPFYQQFFSGLDRQLVLVDILGALNAGEAALSELKQSILLILQSFNYGPNHWLRRVFKPRISKVLFAVSKADHVTPDQHQALSLLLQQLVAEQLSQSQYQLCQFEVMVLAAVRASDAGSIEHQGQQQPCLRATKRGQTLPVAFFPGEVPGYWPDHQLFSAHHFAFSELSPAPWDGQSALPHIRMDHALEFLLGDKLG
ncbi:YcjX family protein [Rheinheimera marina]|uniref:YcjX family protein n=1 Tax=Rheinheimera marina TaxID=1774958 RepID=A0ABV9JK87_9GAMM